MSEVLTRIYTCCFTGHRPEKLDITEAEAKKRLEQKIQEAFKNGYTTFMSGMAQGFDMWAAEVVLEKRTQENGIQLVCAVPFEGVERKWSEAEKQRYHKILSAADQVYFVCAHYSVYAFQLRNTYMVDHSSLVIAAYNGEKGGTENTIRYAAKKGVPFINICSSCCGGEVSLQFSRTALA